MKNLLGHMQQSSLLKQQEISHLTTNLTHHDYPITAVVIVDIIQTTPYLVDFHIAPLMTEVSFLLSSCCHPQHHIEHHTLLEAVLRALPPPL